MFFSLCLSFTRPRYTTSLLYCTTERRFYFLFLLADLAVAIEDQVELLSTNGTTIGSAMQQFTKLKALTFDNVRHQFVVSDMNQENDTIFSIELNKESEITPIVEDIPDDIQVNIHYWKSVFRASSTKIDFYYFTHVLTRKLLEARQHQALQTLIRFAWSRGVCETIIFEYINQYLRYLVSLKFVIMVAYQRFQKRRCGHGFCVSVFRQKVDVLDGTPPC